ncbi:hypothetical protein BJ165DRAFT_561915 [Panaeolus papilionaceus]|nr:hypothetical protein BJ165DRAFT_561915 [Panaeolus papilionaceus]
MHTVLKPIQIGAIKRAQAADPNSQRCLVENCSTTQAVEVAHVFSRDSDIVLVETLEWNWAMAKGSLNLDTRQNVFFLGASMHKLYKDKKWVLLPDKDIIYEYFDAKRVNPLSRHHFPKIEGDTFEYRLFPLDDLEDIYVTRQSSDPHQPNVTVHRYPFDDLPPIISHVHPKYALLQLGYLFHSRSIRNIKSLVVKFPWLRDVLELYVSWTSIIPDCAATTRSYIPNPHPEAIGLSLPPCDSDDEGSCTPLRRIRGLDGQVVTRPNLSSRNRGVPVSDHRSGATSRINNPPCHRPTAKKRSAPEVVDQSGPPQKKQILTSDALKMQSERDDLESVKWTSHSLGIWAQDCGTPSLPPPPPSPSTPAPAVKPLLRRSARIRARTRKA